MTAKDSNGSSFLFYFPSYFLIPSFFKNRYSILRKSLRKKKAMSIKKQDYSLFQIREIIFEGRNTHFILKKLILIKKLSLMSPYISAFQLKVIHVRSHPLFDRPNFKIFVYIYIYIYIFINKYMNKQFKI
jgi:hypothetical protein